MVNFVISDSPCNTRGPSVPADSLQDRPNPEGVWLLTRPKQNIEWWWVVWEVTDDRAEVLETLCVLSVKQLVNFLAKFTLIFQGKHQIPPRGVQSNFPSSRLANWSLILPLLAWRKPRCTIYLSKCFIDWYGSIKGRGLPIFKDVSDYVIRESWPTT